MKILFLPNWKVHKITTDEPSIQSPDKQVTGEPYWFFRYFPLGTEVDIIDYQEEYIFHPLEKKIKFYIYQSVKAFFKRKKYDVVISHGAQSGLIYSLLNRTRRKKNRPLHVIIDVGAMNGGRTNKFEVSLIKQALKSNPGIIYHSSVQQHLYETTYRNEIKQSRFIHFGANTDEFKPLKGETKDYVLSFGRAKRDYKTLIESWKQINSETNLYIIGDPTIVSEGNIHSFPKVDVFQLKEYIAQSLFVVIPLPFFNYSYGQMSFIQSMAMAKPVVVTQTPSSTDYLQEEVGAFFVNPYDVADMKKKLTYLLANREKLDEWGRIAREYIIANLNEKEMSSQIYQFIQEMQSQKLRTLNI